LARQSNNVHRNVIGALLLGVPWDPVESKESLSKFWNNLIVNKHMTDNLIQQVKR